MVPYESERAWIERLEQIESSVDDLAKQQAVLEQWLGELEQDLTKYTFLSKGFDACHELSQTIQKLNQQITAYPKHWGATRQALQPALDLAHAFYDKVVFLVFGKFNAGKSSFCNFLSERFAYHKKSVEYFFWEQGAIHYHAGPFQEGLTETTVRIQGVVLANRLVLLDTPGLHSMTVDNAQLTQQFLEAADGMLWLSSSTSPGQVQELEELAQELRRRKALLPIITRSDYLDEVVVKQSIQKELKNKSQSNRALQEQDVWLRAQEKLQQAQVDPQLVLAPISISVYFARQNGVSHEALEQAGFYRLYQALSDLIESAVAYKQRKPIEVLWHYLEEIVVADVMTLLQRLEQLGLQLDAHQKQIEDTMRQVAQRVWQQTMAAVPALLDSYLEQDSGAKQVNQALQSMIKDTFTRQTKEALSAYFFDMAAVFSTEERVELDGGEWAQENYERLYLDIEQQVERLLADLAQRVIKQAHPYFMAIRQVREDLVALIEDKKVALDQLSAALVHTHH